MIEVRFGIVGTHTWGRGFSATPRHEKNRVEDVVSFMLTPEQLRFWTNLAEKYNNPIEFSILLRRSGIGYDNPNR